MREGYRHSDESHPELVMAATANRPIQGLPVPPPSITRREGWTLHAYPAVTSTNLMAASLPPWSAVRADVQTAGRGRFQRTWISDQGGLWLSAVVPLSQEEAARRALSLVAGLGIGHALLELRVPGWRLRWPNDLMVGERKLAGLLIDHFAPGRTVIGVGLNVSNQPEALDPTLKNRTAHLSEFLAEPPALEDLAILLLRHLRTIVLDLDQQGAPTLLRRIDPLWGAPRVVELDLDGTFRRGLFTGVDAAGRLRLTDAAGNSSFYEAHQVRQLTEI
jgi:BirA family biotin operon repressor/biotin-[acetyl-CoA-carboxylase] ligase